MFHSNQNFNLNCTQYSEVDKSEADKCHTQNQDLFHFKSEWLENNCDTFYHFFYLELTQSDNFKEVDLENVTHQMKKNKKLSPIVKMKGLKTNYSKLTDWMLGKKNSQNDLKKSFKNGFKNLKIDQKVNLNQSSINSSKSTLNDSLKSFFNLIKNENQQTTTHHLFTLLYLATPVDNSSNEKDHAVFVFPNLSEQSQNNQLNLSKRIIKLKGMFVSLSQIIDDIVGQLPSVSKINLYCKSNSTHVAENITLVTNDDKIFNSAYVQEFNNTLALCIAEDQFSESEVIALVSSIARLICFLYNSLDAAFKNINNHSNLNQLLEIFNSLLNQEYLNQNICFLFDSVQKLMIDEDLLLCIDEALNEYEALDWLSDKCSIDTGISNSEINFLIVGSVLFYCGYLISSHLSPNYLSDIISFLKFRGLLTLNRFHSNRLVIWQEVYPSSFKTETLCSDFSANEGTRYFLLVIGIERTLLVTLLEMPFMEADSRVKPNPAIINQAIRFVSLHLNKSGLMNEINQHIQAQAFLYTSSLNPDIFLTKNSFLKSVSMKELFTFSSNRNESNFSCHYSSSISSSHSSIQKSQSSPSLPQSSSKSVTLNQSNHSDESFEKSDLSFCCEPEFDDCDCSPIIPKWVNYYSDNYCFRFPNNFIFYLEIDFKSKTYLGPIFFRNHEPNSEMLKLCKHFRDCCIFISSQLRLLYPEINKYGTHFSFKNELSNSKVKSKRLEMSNELSYWVICRKDSADRELYILYKIDSKEKEISFNSKIEPLFYRLAL